MNIEALRPIRLVLALLYLAGAGAHLRAQDAPLTVAEASGFEATSRHADVLAFIQELQRQSALVRVEQIATTAEGRPLPLIVIGDPVPTSPADLQRDGRAVVYFQANIHAGEVEGKEAALMLARDLALGKAPNYLDRLVVLICPNFNPDGNDKISPRNRTRQKGPVQGVGVRPNGQNLDLNRDGVKLETPEVCGLVERVLRRWDPVFFLDSHTHNGSYHEEPVTWTWGLNPNGDPALFAFMAETMLPAVTRQMRERYGTATIPHGDFVDPRDPQKGWVPMGPQPRYLVNYVGLRNRLSVLNENYPYADFETRVRGAHALFRTFLDLLHARRDEVTALVAAADARSIARGCDPGEGEAFIVEFERAAIAAKLTIQGYEMELVESASGRQRYRPTERVRTYEEVPYFARYTPKRTVAFPRAYLITARDEAIAATLLQHGIAVERLLEPATLQVESFKVTELSGAERLYQGHHMNTVKGEYELGEREFPAGTLFVSTAQALGPLAACLLEPESDDGLLVWNFFDRYLAAQWSRAPQIYPVFKLHEQAKLVTG